MKQILINLSYSNLAELFVTTKQQIRLWICRGKLNVTDYTTIFELYRLESMNILKRRDNFASLYKDYKDSLSAPKEKEYVDRMLKEWDRENEIIQFISKSPSKETVKTYIPLFKK
jgi:hypothetical protein